MKSLIHKYNLVYYILFKYNILMEYYSNIMNNLDDYKFNKDTETETETEKIDKYSYNISSLIHFIIDNYKQILLFILVFVIIYVVEHITYYNSVFYGLANSAPSIQQQQQTRKQIQQQIQIQPNLNTFKRQPKKYRNNKKY